MMESKFKLGEPVEKLRGYAFDGFIVSIFQNSGGEIRYVVEHETIKGMLHIFSGEQLSSRPTQGVNR